MSSENQLPPASNDLAQILGSGSSGIVDRLALEDGLAKERGLLLDGSVVGPEEARGNYERYGAESPRERYCKMFPAITIEDLARDWEIKESVMRKWATAGKWDEVRKAWLQHVPLEAGGQLATGDLAIYKHKLIFEHLAELSAARDVVNKSIQARTEEALGKQTVEELRKTSRSLNEDVQSLTILQSQERTVLGQPIKYSATMTQTTTEKRQVKASTVQAPQRGGVLRAPIEPTSTITTTTTETLEAG